MILILSAWGFQSANVHQHLRTPKNLELLLSVVEKSPTSAKQLPDFQPEPLLLPQPTLTILAPPGTLLAPNSLTSAPVVHKVPTTEPVVFLGIDDGWTKSPETQSWLLDHRLPFTLFLTDAAIKNNYEYFGRLQAAGLTIEDHTLTHPNLTKLSLEQQKTEICGTADIYQTVFGSRPTLFRPPYGAYNEATLQAAAACGMKAIVLWRAIVKSGVVQFQNGTALEPGDIVLMHVRPEFIQDIQAFMNQVAKDHLQVGRLEDWLY